MKSESPKRHSLPALVVTVLGMSGLRLDRLRLDALSVTWVSVWLGSTIAVPLIFDRLGLGTFEAAVYLTVSFVVYYGGLTLFLGHRGRNWLIERLGPKRSVRWFEAGLGIAFTHQAVSQGVLASVTRDSLGFGVPAVITTSVGLAALAVALLVKIWSTHIVGLDVYYYRDMFLQRGGHTSHDSEEFVEHGPYRWLSNPMYGVGNLSAYGIALVQRSWLGLVASAIAQICIYAFYLRYERPFVQRYYLADEEGSASQAA